MFIYTVKTKTWHIELLIVTIVICCITLFFQNNLINWITTFAVFLTFNYVQIADRLQERQRLLETPSVECYWKLNIFYIAKESTWLVAFILMKNYAALGGVILFILYPYWRKHYRKYIKPLKMSLTTDPQDPCLFEGKQEVGQNNCYLVLTEEERSMGFIRPYRETYVHVGKKVELDNGGVLRELTDEEKIRYSQYDYVAFIEYNEEWKKTNTTTGRFVLQSEYDAIKDNKKYLGGCGTSTSMGKAIAETYAREPQFYSRTFCVHCNKHLDINEFVWHGTEEQVGS